MAWWLCIQPMKEGWSLWDSYSEKVCKILFTFCSLFYVFFKVVERSYIAKFGGNITTWKGETKVTLSVKLKYNCRILKVFYFGEATVWRLQLHRKKYLCLLIMFVSSYPIFQQSLLVALFQYNLKYLS